MKIDINGDICAWTQWQPSLNDHQYHYGDGPSLGLVLQLMSPSLAEAQFFDFFQEEAYCGLDPDAGRRGAPLTDLRVEA